jgi:hypothetical protein
LIHYCAHHYYPHIKVENNEQLHNLIYSLARPATVISRSCPTRMRRLPTGWFG